MTTISSEREYASNTTRYSSTRDRSGETVDFWQATLSGMAPDKGLYVPTHYPQLQDHDLETIKSLPYDRAAAYILEPYLNSSIQSETLRTATHEAYKNFRREDGRIVHISKIDDPDVRLMELYWGPTFSFKDIALQLIGQIFRQGLPDSNSKPITIVSATSGDTGSAAIEAFKQCNDSKIIILHPHGKISEVQRRQMTTVDSDNVLNIAIEGNFDDCQNLVKQMFAEREFKNGMNLTAVNSVNWARIACQIVYYVKTSVEISSSSEEKVSFCVPTGNFGNALAGYIAKQMGSPIDKIIIANNENNMIERVCNSNAIKIESTQQTVSCAMDVSAPSNFERLLFDLNGRDGNKTKKIMESLCMNNETPGLERDAEDKLKDTFLAGSASDKNTRATIKNIYETEGGLVDPHTAVGIHVASKQALNSPIVVASTADPFKFPEEIERATGESVKIPDVLSKLKNMEEKFQIVPNDLELVKKHIRNHVDS